MPKVIINKGKKEFVPELDREISVVKQRSYYVKETSKDFHTEYGIISAKDMKKDGMVKTSSGKEFSVFEASFIDDYKRIERLAQIIPLKDVGAIIACTGINRNSVIIDSGTGSGALAIFLASVAKEVVSYDINDRHLEIARNNVKELGIKNLKIKKGDATKGFEEKDVDVVTLDLPAPWEALGAAKAALKLGGFIVSYSPSMPQVIDFVNAASKDSGLIHVKTIEIIERQWEIEKRIVRPSSDILVSGFLTFCRRIA